MLFAFPEAIVMMLMMLLLMMMMFKMMMMNFMMVMMVEMIEMVIMIMINNRSSIYIHVIILHMFFGHDKMIQGNNDNLYAATWQRSSHRECSGRNQFFALGSPEIYFLSGQLSGRKKEKRF